MKMVANETELRNALKEKAPEITIVTSYADTVKKKYGLDLKANPLGKMLVTGFGPVVNHFMNPIGEELSWYKIQFYTPGKPAYLPLRLFPLQCHGFPLYQAHRTYCVGPLSGHRYLYCTLPQTDYHSS